MSAVWLSFGVLLIAIIWFAITFHKKQKAEQAEVMEEDELELDEENMDQKAKMEQHLDNFDFLFDFPEIEEYEAKKEEWVQDPTPAKKDLAMRFLMKRAGALAQKGSLFNQAAPRLVAKKKAGMCNETHFANLQEAKEQLDAEGANIQAEANEFKPGWGKEIFNDVVKLQREHVQRMQQQQAMANGQAPRQAAQAQQTPQQAQKPQRRKPNSQGRDAKREALRARIAAKKAEKQALNAQKDKGVNKAELAQKQAQADKAFKQLAREEENKSKAKKKKKSVSRAADDLD